MFPISPILVHLGSACPIVMTVYVFLLFRLSGVCRTFRRPQCAPGFGCVPRTLAYATVCLPAFPQIISLNNSPYPRTTPFEGRLIVFRSPAFTTFAPSWQLFWSDQRLLHCRRSAAILPPHYIDGSGLMGSSYRPAVVCKTPTLHKQTWRPL